MFITSQTDLHPRNPRRKRWHFTFTSLSFHFLLSRIIVGIFVITTSYNFKNLKADWWKGKSDIVTQGWKLQTVRLSGTGKNRARQAKILDTFPKERLKILNNCLSACSIKKTPPPWNLTSSDTDCFYFRPQDRQITTTPTFLISHSPNPSPCPRGFLMELSYVALSRKWLHK